VSAGHGPGEAAGPTVPASLTIPYTVRFDECGPDGLARTSALLRYAQDIAWVHAEQMGINRDWSRAHGLTWLVRAAEVAVLRPIPIRASLQVTTRLGGARRVLARRRTEVRLEDGSLASWGHTDWVVIDDRGRPARLPPDFLERVSGVASGFEPCRVPLTAEPPDAVVTRFAVRPQDLDPLAHVNNGAYVDYLEEAVLAAGPPGEAAVRRLPRLVRVDYVVPAEPGMRLRGVAWPTAEAHGSNAWAWRLTNETDQEVARGQIVEEAGEAA
jgi:acyl-CoA thioesterase FadM